MIKVTLNGVYPEIDTVMKQMKKDYFVTKCELHPEEHMIYLEMEIPDIKNKEHYYEMELPKNDATPLIEILEKEDIKFRTEEEEERVRFAFRLLDKKRVEAIFKQYCISCGKKYLHTSCIYVEKHMKEHYEKALDEKGIDYTFNASGNGYKLELAKIDIPAFEKIRQELNQITRNIPLQRQKGSHMSSHRHRSSRTR